jgi:hypothetical protein
VLLLASADAHHASEDGAYYDVLEKPPHGERDLVKMLRTGAFGAHEGR